MAKMGGGNWVVDPSLDQQKSAALSLLYAGTHNACTLLEVQVGMAQHAFHLVQCAACFVEGLGMLVRVHAESKDWGGSNVDC